MNDKFKCLIEEDKSVRGDCEFCREINFKVDDKQVKMEELARKYSDGQFDSLDGVTIRFKNWWFNCRPSNTEPLLRLNVEARSKEILEDKISEIESMLGKPV